MSLTMIQDVILHSPSKGNARLVELVMAEAVNEERVQLGHDPVVWLSQNTIATRCKCSRSTVERGLDALKELGRVFDTGQRMNGRYRGTVVYCFGRPDLTDSESPDLTDPDVTQNESGHDDLTDSARDLTHPGHDLTHSAPRPASTLTHKPGVEPEVKPEGKTDAPVPAREAYPDGDADAARVAAQRDHNATVTDSIISGLSPSSSGIGGLTDAQTQADPPSEPEETREQKEALHAYCERMIARGQGSANTLSTRDRLAAELGVEATA